MIEMDWIEECKELQEGHFARDLCPRLVGILPLLYTRSAPVDQWVAHATTEEEMQ